MLNWKQIKPHLMIYFSVCICDWFQFYYRMKRFFFKSKPSLPRTVSVSDSIGKRSVKVMACIVSILLK